MLDDILHFNFVLSQKSPHIGVSQLFEIYRRFLADFCEAKISRESRFNLCQLSKGRLIFSIRPTISA